MSGWARALPQQTWYFERVSTKRAWQPRAAFFAAFAGNVVKTT